MGQGPRPLMHRRAFLGLPAAALALGGCERPAPIEGGFTGINDQRGHALRDMREAPAPQATRRTSGLSVGWWPTPRAEARGAGMATTVPASRPRPVISGRKPVSNTWLVGSPGIAGASGER